MNENTKQVYCSLDIETSGFDPVKNEVLEVGLAFFIVEDGHLVITKEWTRVFKANLPVPATILGLTGITQQELDSASPFTDYKEELQELLKDATIVGHNVIFDITFLEGQGIQFSGKVIDTLDMVQFLLPTHHSYNLENLTHTFGISHKDAHRALADAKASLLVLEKLLGIFNSFPKTLKNELQKLSEEGNFLFAELLSQKIEPVTFFKKNIPLKIQPAKQSLKADHIYNFSLGTDVAKSMISAANQSKEKFLFVLPKTSQVMDFWEKGYAEAVFSEDFLFSEEKFEAMLKASSHTPEEIRFLMKVLVWKQVNWQHEYLLDLNLSFFGGQFKSLITGSSFDDKSSTKVISTDIYTFQQFAEKGRFSDRTLVVIGLNALEQAASSVLGAKASWGYINFLLKSFYNPELQTGLVKYKEIVEQALLKSDLFFGLVNGLLIGDEQFLYVTVNAESLLETNMQKVKQSAANFAEYLQGVAKELSSDDLGQFAASLLTFFEPDPEQVRWIELAEARCVFYSTPIDISKTVQKQIAQFKKVMFADSIQNTKIVNYFQSRLGIQDFESVNLDNSEAGVVQQDLFVTTKDTSPSISCTVSSKALEFKDVINLLNKDALPAAVLFGSTLRVKDFHEQYYQKLKEHAFLVTQNNSGGSNKMLHNFSIHENSLLLATGKFVLKHLGSGVGLSPVTSLPVKTLIIGSLPFDQYTHPYQQAVASRFANPFEEYSLPKALYNLQCILEFFYTKELESIYIADNKLSKEYGKVFYEYLEDIKTLKIQ